MKVESVLDIYELYVVVNSIKVPANKIDKQLCVSPVSSINTGKRYTCT